jgi:lysozyme
MLQPDKVKAEIIGDEGKRKCVYPDELGFLTIGVGRLVDPRKPGAGLTDDEIDYILMNDLRRAEAIANSYQWYDWLDWPRQGVIVCMIFQLGAGGLNGFVNMRAALERKDYETAANEMLDSTWAKQTPARAQRMANIMRSGVWPE